MASMAEALFLRRSFSIFLSSSSGELMVKYSSGKLSVSTFSLICSFSLHLLTIDEISDSIVLMNYLGKGFLRDLRKKLLK